MEARICCSIKSNYRSKTLGDRSLECSRELKQRDGLQVKAEAAQAAEAADREVWDPLDPSEQHQRSLESVILCFGKMWKQARSRLDFFWPCCISFVGRHSSMFTS